MTNPLVIAGAVVGGVYLAQSEGIVRPRGDVREGTSSGQYAGDAATAAMNYLRSRKAIASVPFGVPADNSPLLAFKAMRDAQVATMGKLGGEKTPQNYPRGLNALQLADVCAAWISAVEAGRGASSTAMVNYSYVDTKKSPALVGLPVTDGLCNENTRKITGAVLTPLGAAVCSCRNWQQFLTSIASYNFVTDDQVRETFDRAQKVAREMDGADYAFPGTRVTEQDYTLSDVAGGIAAAGAASADFVAAIAGDAAGAIAGAIVGSPAVWALGLGLLVWFKVVR